MMPAQDMKGDSTPRASSAHGIALAVGALLLGCIGPALARVELMSVPQRQHVRIYLGSETALVEEEREVAVDKGRNKVTFVWQNARVRGDSLYLQPLTHAEQVSVVGIGFPPGSANAVVWEVDSVFDGEVRFRVGYQIEGLTWRPEYTAVTDEAEQTLALTASAVITNSSGEKFENATIQLGTGEPLQGSLQVGETLKTQYLSVPKLRIRKTYSFDRSRWGASVAQHYVVVNDTASGLGKEPLYPGKVRFFKRDAQGELAFIGEDWLKHLPVNEEAELYAGNARDISVKWAMMESARVNLRRDTNGNLEVYDAEESFKLELESHKAGAVKLRLREHIEDCWTMASASHEWTKEDARTAQFDVALKPQEKVELTYRVLRRNLTP